MGIWRDIQSHPTRPRPLPHLKPHPHIFNTFVPTKHTNQVADLQEQLFSLFFLDQSIIALNRFLGRRMSNCARIVFKNTHRCKRFCFSTPYYCTANPPTDRSQHVLQFVRQYSAYMSTLSANWQHPPKFYACMAAINGSTTCGRGFGLGNGFGLLSSDWILHQNPTPFFFPEIYEMCFQCSSNSKYT